MYKLVAIDLDGTMLNKYGIITQNTKDVIKKVQEKGIEVVIASGRTINSVKNFSKEINSQNYFISGNGAITYDIKKDELIKVNKVIKLYQIKKDDAIVTLDANEIEDVKKLTKEIV